MRIALILLFAITCVSAAETIYLGVAPQELASREVEGIDPEADSFSIEVQIDPVVAEGGDVQVVASLSLGMPEVDSEGAERPVLKVDLRETAAGLFTRSGMGQMISRPSRLIPKLQDGLIPQNISTQMSCSFAKRKDCGIDRVIRRFPGDEAVTFDSEEVTGDLAIISRDAENHLNPGLELSDGIDSVAKRLLE